MFLTNCWYVVAWDYEVKQKPFARTVCGEPIVLYRRLDRSLAALEDCCPHRLLVDNLMDLTHETFVHPTSIGQEEISRAPIKTTADDASVTVTRWMHDIEPPPFWATNLKSKEKCDRWQIGTFTLPANVMIDVGVARAGTGAPEGNRTQRVTGIVIDVMTPESATSCWYYWGMARDFEIKDQGLTYRIKDAQSVVFAEDIAVLEAQQQNLLRWPDREPRNFNIDAGGVRARRLVERRLAEQSTPAAT